MADIKDIKKLSPEERIQRLKKLEEEKRKELEETEKLMKQSVAEFETQEKIKREIPIPQVTAVDINELFTQEEKQMFAAKRYQKAAPEEEEKPQEATLEDEVLQEQPQLTAEQIEEQKQYGQQLAAAQPNQLYQMARDAYNEFRETGQVDQGRMYALDVATKMKDDASPAGGYKAPTEEAQEQFGSVKSIIKYLRGR
jgi:hypothetical protein